MPAVVPFIPLIVGAATAGTAVATSKMQGNAQNRSNQAQLTSQRESLATQERMSQQAADAEKQAADRAEQLTLEQRNYDREAARLAREDYLQRQSPYINMGNQAFGRLSELLNIPTNGAGPMPSGGASMSSPPSFAPPQVSAKPSMATAQAVPQAPGASMASVMGAPSVTQAQPSIGAGSQESGARGVQMRAPTGEIGIVPYDKVAQAITAGARRVS
jgi:hypothetical protein